MATWGTLLAYAGRLLAYAGRLINYLSIFRGSVGLCEVVRWCYLTRYYSMNGGPSMPSGAGATHSMVPGILAGGETGGDKAMLGRSSSPSTAMMAAQVMGERSASVTALISSPKGQLPPVRGVTGSPPVRGNGELRASSGGSSLSGLAPSKFPRGSY